MRTTRSQKTASAPPRTRRARRGAAAKPKVEESTTKVSHDSDMEEEDEDARQVHAFDGVEYETYQEMVNAKRKRNQQILEGLGFAQNSELTLSAALSKTKASASQRGIRSKKQKVEPIRSRKSTRLSGKKTSLVSLDYYVPNWNTDNSIRVVAEGDGGEEIKAEEEPFFFKGRLNDGSDLSLKEAIELNEPKWISDDSVELSLAFQKEIANLKNDAKNNKKSKSPRSVVPTSSTVEVDNLIQDLSIDNQEWVAKVTPERIYSVASHPSESKTIACAGDKAGYVGLWDVDSSSESNNGVHLFHVHSRPVCCLNWLTSDTMISASYDGTVRKLNVETGTFQQIFSTYDSDSCYKNELGYGLDRGYNYWLQYATADPRYHGSSPGLFLSTSKGEAMHVDLRVSGKHRITFNETLSEKKINSLSLHPGGYTLASAGLDNTVNLWDIRKFESRKSKKAIKPIASQNAGRSINSAFFSPSGSSLLTTSMADRLDLFENAHLESGILKPTKSIRHNNQTGRWLTTFMANWHPQLDIFVSGSMAKPRCIESFDSNGNLLRAVTGESLGSVMSRCCYHASAEKLAIIGGNSSGRVVVIR